MCYHLFERTVDLHHPVFANLNEETATSVLNLLLVSIESPELLRVLMNESVFLPLFDEI